MGEECPRGRVVTAFGDQDVDDVTVLIDRAVQLGPPAGDLHVGLIEEPSVACRMPRRASNVDERWRGGLLHHR